MKSLLFLMPSLPGAGAEKVLIEILRHIDYTQYNVSLFLEYREGVYLQDVPDKVSIIALHGPNNLWFQRLHRRLVERGWYAPFHELVYRRMFLTLLRGKRYDTIISFMEGSAVKFHSYIFDKGKRNISWVHIDFQQKHWSLDFFRDAEDERQCYEKMDKIIFVSNDAKTGFDSLFHLSAEKYAVHYNIIDADRIRRLSQMSTAEQKNRFTICMLGRLNTQKRHDRAISVAKTLKELGYDFELWIIGDGELREKLENQIIEAGLQDVVKLKGFINPPYSMLAQADIFLNTSEAEGFSLVVAEAFCLGIPVVSTNVSGPRELLGDSEYGILTSQEEKDIASAVRTMMDNSLLRKHYSVMSITRSQMFNVDASMSAFYKLL